jgi:serine O-acetyltransferase
VNQGKSNLHLEDAFNAITQKLLDYGKLTNCSGSLPSTYVVPDILESLKHLLFPRFYHQNVETEDALKQSIPKEIAKVHKELSGEIEKAYAYQADHQEDCIGLYEQAQEVTLELLEELPAIRHILECDLEEVMSHDPAAKGTEEVLLAYPGFEAITVHRIAHFLNTKQVPLLPRMMSEWVHRRTGIDIHPGARIAPYCSIDHGTGLIIGETTIIGQHVNLFHNVTLGARSVTPEFRGCKRHPTIGDHVIIYPGATILGDIKVGQNSVIGGNVFLLESCPDDSKIYAKPPEIIIRKK